MGLLCDKCEKETDSAETMPHPVEGGDLCYECYLEADYQHNLKLGREFLTAKLPSMDDFVKVYANIHCEDGVKLGGYLLEGNCHPAAIMLVRECRRIQGMTIVLKRGHWLGRDVRPSRANYPGQQHSWTEVKIAENPVIFIADPTQFVFTGAPPQITISNEDDLRYDPGSFRFNELMRGPRKLDPRCTMVLIASNLKPALRECLARVFDDRDWRFWSLDELFEIANLNPGRYGQHAKELYQAIDACNKSALIPIDAWRSVMGEPA